MTPYLSLDKSKKNEILRILDAYCPSEDIKDAVLTTLEEFGDDEKALREVLEELEVDRVVGQGMTGNLFMVLEQKPRRKVNWRKAKRRRVRQYK